MAVRQTWEERHEEQAATVGFIVDGPTTRADVAAALLSSVPASYDWLVLNRIQSVDLIEGHLDAWKCLVKYGAHSEKRDLQSGDMEFRFETSGVSVRRTVSISSRVFGPSGLVSPAPPDAQLIRWNQDTKSAEGADVDETAYSFGWTVIVPFSLATEAWRRQIGELRGTVNAGSFFGYAAGECRFENITGSVRGGEDYRFTLNFSRRPNVASLSIGGITVTSLKGWEYIDTEAQKFQVNTTTGVLMPVVTRVKIHEMFPSASWSALSSLLGV